MTTPLRVLFVEDSEDDMLLQLRELRQAGYEPRFRRVETAAALAEALRSGEWDVILADYTLPRFTGIDALRQVKQAGLDAPFLLLSGTVGEEVAVESMKAGAADYLLKSSLTRLAPAVKRELREAAQRRARRQAEEALRHNQSLLSLIYAHTDEMLTLFIAADEGPFRAASLNRAWQDFTQKLGRPIDPGQLVGRDAEDVFLQLAGPSPARDLLVAHFRAAQSPAGASASFELEWVAPDGPLFTEQQLIAFGDAGGQHILWAARDITARKQTESQQRRLEAHLAHAQKLEALGTLASGIASDFNNILAGLSAHSEQLKLLLGALPPAQEPLAQLTAGIHRATDLVRRILAFSRKRTTLRKPIHLGPVIHEAMQFLRPLVPREVTVDVSLPTDAPHVLADAGQIHQVAVNLCTNALQALPASGGRIRVALETVSADGAFAAAHPPLRAGPHVRLRVADSGCGMDEPTQVRLFEPFFTTKPPGVGTGLGLAIVANIVKAHNGAVAVTTRPGAGSTFDLYFPTAEETEKPPQPAGPAGHVLFVDDEEYLTVMAVALLKRLGYEVTGHSDPTVALAAFEAAPGRFSVLITDVNMPGLKGTDLAARVRRIRPDLPVILATGFSGPHELDRAQAMGFTLVLEKPFTVAKFVEALEQALRQGKG